MGALGHEVRGEDEPPLMAVTGFDCEVVAAIEALRQEFLEKLVVQRLRES